jgi:hypothetical protein
VEFRAANFFKRVVAHLELDENRSRGSLLCSASLKSLWSSMKGRTEDVLASVGSRAWKAAISLGKLSNER